jgi:SAM-dependent methyltransferase
MSHRLLEPSPWIVRFASLVATNATLLDAACGYGRHAKFFAARGVRVTAVDRDETAIDSLRGIDNILAELRDIEGADTSAETSPDAWPYDRESYDAIVVCNYLWRPTFERMLDSMKPNGVLLYETFMMGNERYGKPSRPEYLLAAGELQSRVAQRFEIVETYEGAISNERNEIIAMKAMITARKR